MKYYYLCKHYVKRLCLFILRSPLFIFIQNRCYFRRKQRLLNTLKSKFPAKKLIVLFDLPASHFTQLDSIIFAMQEHAMFAPIVVAAPPIDFHAQGDIRKTMNECTVALKAKFKGITVLHGLELPWEEYARKADIVFFALPHMNVQTMRSLKSKITCYVAYGGFMLPGDNYPKRYCRQLIFDYLTYSFIECEDVHKLYQKHAQLRGVNAVVSGYPKFDAFIQDKNERKRKRKRVFICPHHSINADYAFSTSNFLQYSEFFFHLFEKYPEIDFIFRPHPALRHRLESELWGKEMTDNYFARLADYPNVEYQKTGDYVNDFMNSDGMILDCCSFMAEYTVTGHPAAYMLRDKNNIYGDFSVTGKKVLDHLYHVFNEEDILNFIDNVILRGNDPGKASREQFAKDFLLINHPYAGKWIVDFLENEIKGS